MKDIEGLFLTARSDRDIYEKCTDIVSKWHFDDRASTTWCSYMLRQDSMTEEYRQLYNSGLVMYDVHPAHVLDAIVEATRSECLKTMYDASITSERQWQMWLSMNSELMFSSNVTYVSVYNHGFKVYRYEQELGMQ